MSGTGYRRFKYSEEDLENALVEIRTKTLTLCGASIKYGVPKATLHNKILDKVPIIRKMGPQTVLSAKEESKLEKWIINKAKVGFPMHPEMVKDVVQSILKEDGRENPFVNDRPGKKWLSLFLKRKPEIVKRNTEIISQARAAVTEEEIRAWFAEVIKFVEEEGVADVLKDSNRIFNCDEIGMQTCPKTGIVLGPKGFKNLYEIASGPEKESITVLCTYSAAGELPPPMVIFPYKRIPSHIADSLPEYVANAFYPWLVENNIEFPVILFLDGHKSHLSLELCKFCIEKGIIVYCLPPNSTHIMQPCDVSMFRPLKVCWKSIVRSRKHKLGKAITKANFVTLFKTAFDESAKKETITNGFRACGLFPFNPDAVDYAKCISGRHKGIRNEESENALTLDEYAITKRVIEDTLGPNATDTLIRAYHGCDYCDESLFKVWKLCAEKLGGLELPNVNEKIQSSQESDRTNNAATDQIQEIEASHSFDGLGALDDIPIELIGSDVDFSLTHIAKELQILDGSNLVDYPIDEVFMISVDTIDTTILESENPETKETDLPPSIPADQSSDKIEAVELNEAIVEEFESKNPITKEIDVSSQIDTVELKKTTVEKPESENPRTNETDVLPMVLMSKKKPTILSNVVIRQAFNTSCDDSADKIWNEHLHWPKLGDKVLKNGQKKGLTEQVPFAITSNKWREIQEKKQKELLEKQEITAKKVAFREEKKKQKEEEQAKKKNKIKKEPQEKKDTYLKRKNKVVKKANDMDENNNTTDEDIVIDWPIARTRRVRNNSDERSLTDAGKENAKTPAKRGTKRKGPVKTVVKKKTKKD